MITDLRPFGAFQPGQPLIIRENRRVLNSIAEFVQQVAQRWPEVLDLLEIMPDFDEGGATDVAIFTALIDTFQDITDEVFRWWYGYTEAQLGDAASGLQDTYVRLPDTSARRIGLLPSDPSHDPAAPTYALNLIENRNAAVFAGPNFNIAASVGNPTPMPISVDVPVLIRETIDADSLKRFEIINVSNSIQPNCL